MTTKEKERQFEGEITKLITDGMIDIDERVNTGKVELLVRKSFRKALRFFRKL